MKRAAASDGGIRPPAARKAPGGMRAHGLTLLAVLAVASAQEVQSHGLVFEKWVRDTFFNGYKPASYTQRWDIPAAENRDHGGVPVNPKAIKRVQDLITGL